MSGKPFSSQPVTPIFEIYPCGGALEEYLQNYDYLCF